MRMPESQLAKIKAEAEQRGMKYQKFMRVLMERGMQSLGPR
jgi:predicted DNA binding CopG/RHH family protein